MTRFRPYAYQGKEKTCLWCGRKLRAYYPQITDPAVPSYRKYISDRSTQPTYGSYRDGKFCGLRSAYDFAIEMVTAGRFFQPRKPS